jgi:hypothetical protein
MRGLPRVGFPRCRMRSFVSKGLARSCIAVPWRLSRAIGTCQTADLFGNLLGLAGAHNGASPGARPEGPVRGQLPAHRHGTPVSRRVVPATTRGPCGHTHHRSFRGFSGLLLVGRHLFFCGGQRGIDFVDRRGCPASWRRQRPFLRLHGFGHSGSCARCRAGPRRERRCFGWARRSIAAAAVVWNPGHSLVS